MKVIEKLTSGNFPFSWVDVDYYPNSNGEKVEIYLRNGNGVSELILMFYTLFSKVKADIMIYNSSWWDYCLDTWEALLGRLCNCVGRSKFYQQFHPICRIDQKHTLEAISDFHW